MNVQAIPKSQYKPGQTYLTSGNGWTPQSFGGASRSLSSTSSSCRPLTALLRRAVHFESLNNQPSGVYIGRNFYDFGPAAQAFPSGYCIVRRPLLPSVSSLAPC